MPAIGCMAPSERGRCRWWAVLGAGVNGIENEINADGCWAELFIGVAALKIARDVGIPL